MALTPFCNKNLSASVSQVHSNQHGSPHHSSDKVCEWRKLNRMKSIQRNTVAWCCSIWLHIHFACMFMTDYHRLPKNDFQTIPLKKNHMEKQHSPSTSTTHCLSEKQYHFAFEISWHAHMPSPPTAPSRLNLSQQSQPFLLGVAPGSSSSKNFLSDLSSINGASYDRTVDNQPSPWVPLVAIGWPAV